jgi:hypothetical protein
MEQLKICKNMDEEGFCTHDLTNRCGNRNKCGKKVPKVEITSMAELRRSMRISYLDGRHWNSRGGLNK